MVRSICCSPLLLSRDLPGMGLGFSSSPEDDDWPFTLLSWVPGDVVSLPNYPRESVFWELSMLMLKVLYNYLPLPREGDKMLSRAFLCGEFGTDSFLARPRRKMFPVVFVVRGMVMGIYFGSAPSPP